MRIRSMLAFFAAATVPFLADVALACTCAPIPPPCEAYWEASAVFSGTVVDVREVTIQVPWGSERIEYQQRLVRFNVIEAFRNADSGSEEVLTGLGDTDCGYNFVVGESYLVYGYRTTDGRLRAHICSRTAPLADAGEDLDYIRGLSRVDTPGRVTGVVRLYSENAEGAGSVYVGALPNVELTLTSDRRLLVTRTDAAGRFAFDDVPPGVYVLRTVVPDGARAPRARIEVHTASCDRVDVKVVEGGLSARAPMGPETD